MKKSPLLFVAVILIYAMTSCNQYCKMCKDDYSDSLISLDTNAAYAAIDMFLSVDTNHISGVGIPACPLYEIMKKVHSKEIWISFGMLPDSSYITVVKYYGSGVKYVGIRSSENMLSNLPTCPPSIKCKGS